MHPLPRPPRSAIQGADAHAAACAAGPDRALNGADRRSEREPSHGRPESLRPTGRKADPAQGPEGAGNRHRCPGPASAASIGGGLGRLFPETLSRTGPGRPEARAGPPGNCLPARIRPPGHREGHPAYRRGPVRLRSRPVPLHRLPPLCLWLRGREQSVAAAANPLDQGHAAAKTTRGSISTTPSTITTPHWYPRTATSTYRSSASNVSGPPAPGYARSRRPGRNPTASWPSTITGVSAAATAWPPAPTAPAISTGKRPTIPAAELNPDTHYLGNRPRPVGVVEKCTFCIQRTREQPGRYPACVEICPVGARKFGNLLDPKGEIVNCSDNKRVFILKQELNTQPKFFYFYES